MATKRLEVLLIGDEKQLQAAFGRAGASASLLEKKFGTAGAAANRVGTQMATLARRAALPAAAIGALSVKSFVDFDRAMTKSTAIMDDVSKKMRSDMVDAARVVGKETEFSATQAAESYFFLASAGLDAQQSLKSMPIVAKFATAGNFDLATATDLVTDAQSALGLTVDKTQRNMRNMTHVSDVLTKANTLANATIEQFSESLTNKGAAALRVLGKDMEEGVAVLATFADQGVKGQIAGNALAIVLRDLQKAAISNESAWKENNLAVFDSNGEMKNMADIVGGLEGALDGMSDKQKKATLTTLGFQERSVQYLLTLIGTSDQMAEYEKELRKAAGTTDKVAKKSLDGFAGSVTRLKGFLQDTGLEIGERLAPTLEELADLLGDDQIAASEKFEQALDIIVGKLEDVAPQAASAGAKIGLKLAEGIVKSFADSGPLGKLFIGAGVIRLFGGRGAIIASGAALGRTLGLGISAGAASSVGGGAAGSAAGGAAAGGLAGSVTSKLKAVKWGRAGMFAIGALAAEDFMSEFSRRAAAKSDDLAEAIKGETDPGTFGGAVEEIFGESDLTRTGREAEAVLDKLREGRVRISAVQSEQLQKGIAELDLTNEQADAVNNINRLIAEGRELDIGVKLGMDPKKLAKITEGLDFLREGVGASLGDIEKVTERTSKFISSELGEKSKDGRAKLAENFDAAADAIFKSMRRGEIDVREGTKRWAELIREADVVNASRAKGRELAREWAAGMDETGEATKDGVKQMLDELEAMPRPARIAAFRTWQGVLKQAVEKGDLTQEEFRKLRSNALGRKGLGGLRDEAPLTAAQAMAGIWQPFKSLFDATGGGLNTMMGNVMGALDALGIVGKAKSLASFAAKTVKDLQKRQSGGPLKIGGSGTGDIVPGLFPEGTFILNRNAAAAAGFQGGGMVPAMVEPGEVAFPPEMAAAAEVWNSLFPRHRQSGGGLNFALGPHNVPPIQYAADHAGGNSHVHVTGTTTPWVVALGKRLQGMGFMVSEHPAFGGVQGQHSATGGHYDALAIDINSAANETRAEVAQIARLLGSGGIAGQVKRLARVMLEGPKGPLLSLGQAALDRVHKGGTSFLDRQQPKVSEGQGLTGSGDVEQTFARVAKKLSTSKTATLALGMAGYAESGMRDLSYGDASSQGALQLLASTASGMGISPHDEKAIASAFFTRGFYGRGGANQLAAAGLPAHLVAQGVQGSAFSSGSNYAAQRGPAQAWMQRYGLKQGGVVGMKKGGGVSLGKLGSGSVLDLISLQVSLAESTEGVADDIEALTDRFGVLRKEAQRTRKQLGELTKGPLLGERDRERIAKEARERSKDAELSNKERKAIREEAKRRVGMREFGGKKGEKLAEARREAKEELQNRLEREAERAKESEREGKLLKRLRGKARKEERRERRSERAEGITDLTSQIEDMRGTREEIAEKTREALEEALEKEMQDRLEAFDKATEAALESLPQAAELDTLRAQDERIADEADRSELVRELERIKKSGSARLIAEHEAELAAFDRAQRIEQLEQELADEQVRIEEERAAARIALEDQLEADRQAKLAQSVADATAAIDTQIAALVEGLDRVVETVTGRPPPGRGKGKKPGKRAHGGPVAPNEPFLVGEEGAELFVPTAAGRVESHRDTERALGGDTNITIHAHGSVADDPFKLANHIAFQLQSRTRLAGVA